MSMPLLNTTPPAYRVRRKRKWLRVSITVAIVLLLLLPLLSGYVTWSLTHPERRPVEVTPKDIGVRYEDISFTSADGTPLKGWFLPAESGKTDRLIVFAHGYSGNRVADKPSLPTAKALTQNGFSVLMFDFRNHGLSGGDLTTVGLKEKDDLISAVHYAEEQGYGTKGIGLLGFSMGASTSLLAAADLPDVQALIVDSPFSDLRPYLEENMPHWSHLPDFPFTNLILWELPLLIDHSPDEVSPLKATEQLTTRPILFIHGGKDDAINRAHSEKLITALAPNQPELWSIPPAKHVGTWELDPVTYMDRVVAFFQQHISE